MSERIEDYQVIDTRTSHLSIPEMVTTFTTTGEALNSHSFFGLTGNWPDWLAGGTRYLGFANTMRGLNAEYRAGNKTKKSELEMARIHAAFSFQLGGQYVIMRAYELRDPSLLLNTFPLKTTAIKVIPDVYAVAILLSAKNGGHREAILKGHHVPKGGPYQLQICKGTPMSEDSWITLPEAYPTCGRIVVPNLDPVSQYFFRIRHNGPKGPGEWSQPVSLIIH